VATRTPRYERGPEVDLPEGFESPQDMWAKRHAAEKAKSKHERKYGPEEEPKVYTPVYTLAQDAQAKGGGRGHNRPKKWQVAGYKEYQPYGGIDMDALKERIGALEQFSQKSSSMYQYQQSEQQMLTDTTRPISSHSPTEMQYQQRARAKERKDWYSQNSPPDSPTWNSGGGQVKPITET